MQGQIFELGNRGDHKIFEVNENVFLQKYKNYPIVLLSAIELYKVLPSLITRMSSPDHEHYEIYDFLKSLESFLHASNWHGNCLLIEAKRAKGKFFAIEIFDRNLLVLKRDLQFTFAKNDCIADANLIPARPIVKKQKLMCEHFADCFSLVEDLYRTEGVNVLNMI